MKRTDGTIRPKCSQRSAVGTADKVHFLFFWHQCSCIRNVGMYLKCLLSLLLLLQYLLALPACLPCPAMPSSLFYAILCYFLYLVSIHFFFFLFVNGKVSWLCSNFIAGHSQLYSSCASTAWGDLQEVCSESQCHWKGTLGIFEWSFLSLSSTQTFLRLMHHSE